MQEEQLEQVRELLTKDKRNHITEEAKEKLSFLQANISRGDFECNAAAAQPQLSTIQEVNTTGMVHILSKCQIFDRPPFCFI